MAKRGRNYPVVPELALWLKRPAATGDADLLAHEAAANPHPGYLTQAEADALYDPLGGVAAVASAPSGMHLLLDGAGLDGEIGPPGPRGTDGAAGAPGQSGAALFLLAQDGEDGPQGPPGVAGADGSAGAAGATGATGTAGPAGPAIFLLAEDGIDGLDGVPGQRGADGAAGSNGAPGSQGPVGAALFLLAADGEDGERGSPGPAGASGAGGSSPYVYTAGGADTAINSITDVTIVTRDVTSVAVGDELVVEAWFTILNNSGATRVCTLTLDFDGLFANLLTTGALATSATLIHPIRMKAVLDVRASNLCYGMVEAKGYTAAGIASGGDPAMLATSLDTISWATSTSDASGTCTVTLKVKSAAATATQTLRLHHFSIRKLTPT